jgi:UDP-2-acetamido-3-amino-2,3-dideoxy-glucuronate N-acetyltransferase
MTGSRSRTPRVKVRPDMRIAVIGYGRRGPEVTRCLRHLLGPEAVAVCEVREGRRVAARREQGPVALIPSWHGVLDDEGIDAVILCTPALTHFELACQALKEGKHVLIEKPFAVGMEQTARVLEEARRRKRVAMAGHVFAYSPHVAALRRLVSRGALGRVRYVYSHRTNLGPRPEEEVGVVWEYLVHDAYLLPLLMGGPPRQVWAHGGDYLRSGILDVVFTTWDFGGGVLAGCQASWYDPEETRRICIVGSKRMALLDDLRRGSRLLVYEGSHGLKTGVEPLRAQARRLAKASAYPIAVRDEDPLLAQCQAFLRAIEEEQPPRGHPQQIMMTTAILDAVERSTLRSGASVPVEGRRLAGRAA